jgi:hypothetical protein
VHRAILVDDLVADRVSIVRRRSASPFSRRLSGMPVILATVSAMMSLSTLPPPVRAWPPSRATPSGSAPSLLAQLIGLVAEIRGALEVLVGDRLFLLLVELGDLLVDVLEVGRLDHRADAHTRARLVDHVDGLVRKEAPLM